MTLTSNQKAVAVGVILGVGVLTIILVIIVNAVLHLMKMKI